MLYISDGFRQTAADLMQVVRVIQVGMDVDGEIAEHRFIAGITIHNPFKERAQARPRR